MCFRPTVIYHITPIPDSVSEVSSEDRKTIRIRRSASGSRSLKRRRASASQAFAEKRLSEECDCCRNDASEVMHG